MKFTKSGGQTGAGPAEWFTGAVQIDGIRNPDGQSAIGCAHVRFAPGARTAWHHHPPGQTLYVTDGIGLVARRGGEVQEIRPGDVVIIATYATLEDQEAKAHEPLVVLVDAKNRPRNLKNVV